METTKKANKWYHDGTVKDKERIYNPPKDKWIRIIYLLESCSKSTGHIYFNNKSILKDKSKDIPNTPGIYIFYINKVADENIIYIEKAGTIEKYGEHPKQGLKGKINNKPDQMEATLMKLIEEPNVDKIIIKWYELYEDYLPGYIEGCLIQSYYDINRRLPFLNKAF